MKPSWNPLKPKPNTPQPGLGKVPKTPLKPGTTVKKQDMPDDPPESFNWQGTPDPDAGKPQSSAPGTKSPPGPPAPKPPPGAPATKSPPGAPGTGMPPPAAPVTKPPPGASGTGKPLSGTSGTGMPPPAAPVTESTEKRSPLKAAKNFFSNIF